VAVVNKEESELLNKLVAGAEQNLKYLPWGEKFECEVFRKPDFTSLEVLAFGSSGIPVGINIPNYDEVRQHHGFKNVNLGNAYGKPTKEGMQYVPEDEKDMHLKYYNPSLFVIVALHELLGHGSGKLYNELPNFPSPLDGKEITTFYKANESWHSVFG
jgi:dipeptidyl-peptidase III